MELGKVKWEFVIIEVMPCWKDWYAQEPNLILPRNAWNLSMYSVLVIADELHGAMAWLNC